MNNVPFDEELILPKKRQFPIDVILMNDNKSLLAVTHYHEYIEILYGLDCDIDISLEGASLPFTNGDMVIFDSSEIHTLNSNRADNAYNKYLVIQFLPQILYTLEQSVTELQSIMPIIINTSDHQKLFSCSELESTVVPSLISSITNEWDKKSFGYELSTKAFILQLFIFIIRHWASATPEMYETSYIPDAMSATIQNAVSYIKENYKNVNAIGTAKACNLSYNYFLRSFKSVTGRGFNDYLNYTRICEAEKMLISSSMGISRIAEEIGYESASYFNKQFKKHKNMSPKEFRKKFHIS